MAKTSTSTQSKEAARSVLALSPRVNRWAESSVLQSDTGANLSLRQLSALEMIDDENTTLGDVAKQLMVTPAVVTGLIDRLEKRGYARRINSTGDRRRIHLALTEKGRDAAGNVQAHLATELADRIANLPKEDIATIERAFSLLDPIVADLEASSASRSR